MPHKGDATYTRRPGKGLFQQFKEALAEPLARHERAGQSHSRHSASRPIIEEDVLPHPTPHTNDIGIPPVGRSASRSTPAPIPSSDGGNSIGQSAVSEVPNQGRLRITPYGNTFLPSRATRMVTRCFTSHFKGHHDWTSASPIDIQEWWRVFEGLCEWDPAHHNEVYRVWHMMAANHYRSTLGDIRREKNPAKRRGRASFMTDAQYAEMEEWWASQEFQEKSSRGKTIQASSSQSSNSTGGYSATYAGGSVSITEHRERMREKDPEKRDPGLFKVMQQTHKKKSGEYVNRRTEEMAAKVSAEIEEQTQQMEEEGIAHDSDEAAIMSAAVGGRKKGRVFGLGSEQHVVLGRRRPGNIPAAHVDVTQTPEFTAQVERVVAEHTAQQASYYERKLERLKRRQRAELEYICQRVGIPPPAPPDNDIDAGGSNDD